MSFDPNFHSCNVTYFKTGCEWVRLTPWSIPHALTLTLGSIATVQHLGRNITVLGPQQYNTWAAPLQYLGRNSTTLRLQQNNTDSGHNSTIPAAAWFRWQQYNTMAATVQHYGCNSSTLKSHEVLQYMIYWRDTCFKKRNPKTDLIIHFYQLLTSRCSWCLLFFLQLQSSIIR